MDSEEITFRNEILTVLGGIKDELHLVAAYEPPEIKMDSVKIPHCPSCQTINPMVTKLDMDEEKTGPFGHFFLHAKCNSCQEVFWAVPDWEVFTDRNMAVELLKDKSGVFENNGN